MKYMTIDGLLIDGMNSDGWHMYVTNEKQEVYEVRDTNKHNIAQNIISYKNCKKVKNETECSCVIDIIYNTER